MDWSALDVSLRLALLTVVLLAPVGVALGRLLAYRRFRGKGWVEAALALPLVLPPTVLGYYLLVAFGNASPLGQLWQEVFGRPLVFTFHALLLASLVFNLPLAVQPMQRAFESIPQDVREAAAACGMRPFDVLWRIELPLAWPGIVTACALAFAHTLGEFGIVLMVGGSIPGETRTVAIAIYDRVQAFDEAGAARMAGVLLAVSLAALALTFAFARRAGARRIP
jgi:molybdate transport system permease protein